MWRGTDGRRRSLARSYLYVRRSTSTKSTVHSPGPSPGRCRSYVAAIVLATGVLGGQMASAQQNWWANHVTASTRASWGTAVAVDSSNDTYTTGVFQGTVDFGGGAVSSLSNSPEAYIAKYRGTNGQYVWARRLGGSGDDGGSAVAVDAGDNLYVTGTFSGTVDFGTGPLNSAGLTDVFILKVDTNSGQTIWAKAVGGSNGEFPKTLAVDNLGKLCVGGIFSGQASFGGSVLTGVANGDAFVACYTTANGTHIWSRAWGSTGFDGTAALAFDAGGNLYAGGRFNGSVNFGGTSLASAGLSDTWIAKFSGANGEHFWSKRAGASSDDYLTGIAVDHLGHAIATGYFSGSTSFGGALLTAAGANAVFVAALHTGDGSHFWSKAFSLDWGPSYGDTANGIAVSPAGDLVITGQLLRDVDFGGGPLLGTFSYDVYLVQFNNNGAHLWSKRFSALYGDGGNRVAIDSAGNVVLVGDFIRAVDFGAASVSAIRENGEAFLAKFSGVQVPSPTISATRTNTVPPSTTPTTTPTRTPTRTPTTAATLTATFVTPPTWTRTATITQTRTPTSTSSFTHTRTTTRTPTTTPTATASFSMTPALPTVTPAAQFSSLSGQIRYYANGIPVPGVTVKLGGDRRDSRTTNENGIFDFGDLPVGTYFVTPEKFGDSAGALTSLDAVYIQQTLSAPQFRVFTPDQKLAADINGSGGIDFEDATLLLRYKVGTLSTLPLANRCLSDWLFRAMISPSETIGVTEPSTGPNTCRPGSVVFVSFNESVELNFNAILIGDTTGNWPSLLSGNAISRRASSALSRRGFQN